MTLQHRDIVKFFVFSQVQVIPSLARFVDNDAVHSLIFLVNRPHLSRSDPTAPASLLFPQFVLPPS
jgi:hypothetical protein